jgi:hypothetical protein
LAEDAEEPGQQAQELSDEHIAEITRMFGSFEEVTRYDEASKTNVPISRIFPNFGERNIIGASCHG